MNVPWFLARRYLASRRGGPFLSFITWIALGGVVVGVSALIVVIGVMTGMQNDLRAKILSANAHLIVMQQGSSLRMDDWRTVLDSVRQTEEVVAAAPFVLTQVGILQTGADYAQPADLYGVSTDSATQSVTDMEESLREGVTALTPPESGLPPVVVGGRLAERMQLFRGDTLLVISLENIRTDPLGGPSPAMRQFEVTGTFTTGMYDYDVRNLYVPLETAQELLGMRGTDRVSGLGVRLTDPERATAVGSELRERLGYPYWVESWITQNRSLFSALKLEKLAMGLILFLIVVVAAFNIVSTLVMVVVDRTREIGILKSMGMTNGQVLRVFMLQGLWIGVIGTTLGTLLGLTVSWVLDTFEIFEIPPDIYFVDKLPVALNPLDVILIVGASIVVAFAATVYPSFQASRLEPVEAIRHE